MANGLGKPRPCMPDSLWQTIKNLTWSDSGFLDGGTQKYLYVQQKEGTTSCGHTAFYLTTSSSGSSNQLMRAKISSSDFTSLKSYTWSGSGQHWVDGATNKNVEVALDTDGHYKIGIVTM